MLRVAITERPQWRELAHQLGFHFHTIEGEPYWTEDAYYQFTLAQIEHDIEDLIQDMDYIPGHFHLELNLNGDLRGPVELRRRDVLLRQDSLRGELEVEAGCLQYAVRNLLGLLAFHLEQLDTAEETFR